MTSITGNAYDSIPVNLVNEAGQVLQINGYIEYGSTIRQVVYFDLNVSNYPPGGSIDSITPSNRVQLSTSREAYEISSNVFGVLNYREVVPASGVFVGGAVSSEFSHGILAFRDSAGFYRLALGVVSGSELGPLVRGVDNELQFSPSPASSESRFVSTSRYNFFGTELEYWEENGTIQYGINGVSINNSQAVPVPIGVQSPFFFP